jgi:D-glycero-D-manno-heptose 1,7-bisphosphate phosphatase
VNALRRAVFLDRDGTLTVEREWLLRPEQIELFPGAAAALRRLQARGLPLVLVTNQSAVARGLLDLPGLERIHQHLQALLAREGVQLAAIYFCPHHPSEGLGPWRRACACRKPLPGMLQQAAHEHHLDLAHSWMIGDASRDLEAGWAVGMPGILVGTGKGTYEAGLLSEHGKGHYRLASDLGAAVELVLADLDQGK